uniref:type I protein arginine methyltransferase n=1 Tax=Buteo japonicus TaxID=224669 RepID=A0A8C0C0D1_9AVES
PRQFYGYLSQQQNMMQDYVRTGTYQRAILQNHSDFKDKIVLDVGCGSGILSFFAAQAGARKIYAVLVKSNNLTDRIVVIPGKVEEVSLPEQVDIIISEPMGYMLFNERMLESYLHAKKYLKPSGECRGSTPVGMGGDSQHPEGPLSCSAGDHQPREGDGPEVPMREDGEPLGGARGELGGSWPLTPTFPIPPGHLRYQDLNGQISQIHRELLRSQGRRFAQVGGSREGPD